MSRRYDQAVRSAAWARWCLKNLLLSLTVLSAAVVILCVANNLVYLIARLALAATIITTITAVGFLVGFMGNMEGMRDAERDANQIVDPDEVRQVKLPW